MKSDIGPAIGITLPDGTSASGFFDPLGPRDIVELPTPALPVNPSATYILFQWGDYSAGGGMNDIGWSGSLENCMAKRTKDNAQIVINGGGEPQVVMEWVEGEPVTWGHYKLKGWRVVNGYRMSYD